MTFEEWKEAEIQRYPEVEGTDFLNFDEYHAACCCKFSDTSDCGGCMFSECAF